jgi:hypothetical protein
MLAIICLLEPPTKRSSKLGISEGYAEWVAKFAWHESLILDYVIKWL